MRQPLSSDVLRSEQCDAAGAHGDAITHLATGARKRDVEAMTRLGKRLLVGDRAPCLPKDGAGLIADASARGGAEAAAVLAVLYAVGASRGHGVAAALEQLILAAERGWESAQAQLRVLAAGPADADPAGEPETAAGGTGAWRLLGQRVDLAAWQTPPAAVDLSDSPQIRSYPKFVSPRACRWFIERSRGRLSRALVYEALSREVMARPTRTNTAAVFNMTDTDLVFVFTQQRMAACLGVSLRQFEAATVLHYDEGEEITDHYDFIDPNIPDYAQEIAQQGERIVTFLVYLNDDYAGGETAFPRLGIEHKGQCGEGLFFVNAFDGRADTRTLHAGRTPAGGEKWIISQFVRNRALL
ncbi:MAG TPA: 2OG-Fe(II) oxygenase [Gammaproteobacteria bacterium]|nr:2OG-Fe(II) oxygenase [Gammaproteobacteria bacterium]